MLFASAGVNLAASIASWTVSVGAQFRISDVQRAETAGMRLIGEKLTRVNADAVLSGVFFGFLVGNDADVVSAKLSQNANMSTCR